MVELLLYTTDQNCTELNLFITVVNLSLCKIMAHLGVGDAEGGLVHRLLKHQLQ